MRRPWGSFAHARWLKGLHRSCSHMLMPIQTIASSRNHHRRAVKGRRNRHTLGFWSVCCVRRADPLLMNGGKKETPLSTRAELMVRSATASAVRLASRSPTSPSQLPLANRVPYEPDVGGSSV